MVFKPECWSRPSAETWTAFLPILCLNLPTRSLQIGDHNLWPPKVTKRAYATIQWHSPKHSRPQDRVAFIYCQSQQQMKKIILLCVLRVSSAAGGKIKKFCDDLRCQFGTSRWGGYTKTENWLHKRKSTADKNPKNSCPPSQSLSVFDGFDILFSLPKPVTSSFDWDAHEKESHKK